MKSDNREKYIMAMDQGTSSSRCIIYDHDGKIVSSVQLEFKQIYPQEGWVEHDPEEIWKTQLMASREAIAKADVNADHIDSIGIANQRETTIVWEKETGTPVYNAIVWQCRRTAPICEKLTADGHSEMIREKTGLIIDPYFSATKLKWILDKVDPKRKRSRAGELLFGTVETWLIWKLTGGRVHITDYSNASRTMMFDIRKLCWDKDILNLLDIPDKILPEPVENSCVYAETDKEIFGAPIKIAGAAGDQQAALFGQKCFKAGETKNTFGTGGFILQNTGSNIASSSHGLLSTIAWSIDNKITYALEGSVFVSGAVIQWLRDELKFIDEAAASEDAAESVPDTAGVYLVPAFTGLGAPYWDPHARGALLGITRGVNKNHIIRAALEAMAYQTYDLLVAMTDDTGVELPELRADGGAAENDFLLEFLAGILNRNVVKPDSIETTSLGAAYLAGLATGYWKSTDEIKEEHRHEKVFTPLIDDDKRRALLAGWHEAVNRVLSKK